MRTQPILLVLGSLLALASASAAAEGSSLRGAGLFVASAHDLTGSTVVDMDDVGGGMRSLRGADGGDGASPAASPAREPAAPPAPDALPPPQMSAGDPATPVAPAPKRSSYRWQSLVPGAIK